MKVGMIALTAALLMLAAPAWAGPADECDGTGDSDSDTVCDALDNCSELANAAPMNCDTDSDGYGNPCDGDFDQNGQVNSTDFSLTFIPDFIAATDSGIGTDMDCNGQVNSTDFSTYYIPQFIGALPGPSGLVP
jgi:hypothetical protein